MRILTDEDIIVIKDCELQSFGESDNYFAKQRAQDRAVAQAQRDLTNKEWIEWGDGWCEHGIKFRVRRHRCFKCWLARKKEAGK